MQAPNFGRAGKSYKRRWNRINNKLGNETRHLWDGRLNLGGEACFFCARAVGMPIWQRDTCLMGEPGVPVWISEFKVEHWR